MRGDDTAMNADRLLEQTAWMGVLARTLVRDSSRAEDLVQETCVAALEARAVRCPPAWLRRVMRILAHRGHREEGRRRSREQRAAKRELFHSSAEQGVEQAELRLLLVETVLDLEEPYRSTVLLRYFAGLTPEEIARRQAVPVATVWTRLNRALERMRVVLDRRSGGRAAWCAVLLPIAGFAAAAPVPSVAPCTTVATPTAGGVHAATWTGTATLGGLALAQKTFIVLGSVALISLGVGVGIGRALPLRDAAPSPAVIARSSYDAVRRDLDEKTQELAAVRAERESREEELLRLRQRLEERAADRIPGLHDAAALLRSQSRLDQVRAVASLRVDGSVDAIQVLLDAFLASTDPVLTAMLEEALLASGLDISPSVMAAFGQMTDPGKLGRLAGMLTSLVAEFPELEGEVVDLFIGALADPGPDGARLQAVPAALLSLGVGAVPALVEFLSDPSTNPEGSQTAAWVLTRLDESHRDLVRDKVNESLAALLEATRDPEASREIRENAGAKTQTLAWLAANRPPEEHDRLIEIFVAGLPRAKDSEQAQSIAWGIGNLRGLSNPVRRESARSLLDSLPPDPEDPARQSLVWAVSHLARPHAQSPLDENFYEILSMTEERARLRPEDTQLQWLLQELRSHEERRRAGD